METQRIMEFPLHNVDKRPEETQVDLGYAPSFCSSYSSSHDCSCGQEFGNWRIPSYAYPSMFSSVVPRSPDDKDGHYVFTIGETLTPRCRNFWASFGML